MSDAPLQSSRGRAQFGAARSGSAGAATARSPTRTQSPTKSLGQGASHSQSPQGQKEQSVPAAGVVKNVGRKHSERKLGMFGMYEISSTGDDLWLTYREMLEVAEEAGIVDKKLMNPLYGALNKLAEGKDAEGFSEEDAKALAIAKFEASKFGDAAGAHAEVLRSLVALMDTARTIIDERKTIKRDGTLGNAGKAELLLPGLKVEVYDSDSSKNRVVYSDSCY